MCLLKRSVHLTDASQQNMNYIDLSEMGAEELYREKETCSLLNCKIQTKAQTFSGFYKFFIF